MIADELTVRINGKLSVSKETARACLVFLSIYINDTDDQIIVKKLEDGCVEMAFLSDENPDDATDNNDGDKICKATGQMCCECNTGGC